MAQALLEQVAPEYAAVSGGSSPAAAVHPIVIDAMREVGIDLVERKPRKVDAEMLARADVVISMGCDDPALCDYPGRKVEDWGIPDPSGEPIDERGGQAAADDRRQEADRHQQRHLRDRRRRLVHPADEDGDHQPVAEVGDALAEREPAEGGRAERPLEPLRDQHGDDAVHGSQWIRGLGGAAEALPPTSG